MTLLRPDIFGAQCPWYGPLFAEFRCVMNTGMIGFKPGEYELIGYLWQANGTLIAERPIATCHPFRAVDVDVAHVFPESVGIDALLGLLLRNNQDPQIATPVTWISRFYQPDGPLASVVSTSAPTQINFPERTGRKLTYRMISPQLMAEGNWRSVSWHANVSANAHYDKPLRLEASVHNAQGLPLAAPPITVPPFGFCLLDLHAMLGEALDRHLESSGGRGAVTVYSPDGGAVGYHMLLNRAGHDIALDHTRPTLHYLDMGYGNTSYLSGASLRNFLKAAVGALRFRAKIALGLENQTGLKKERL
jgi:hypothetical protein